MMENHFFSVFLVFDCVCPKFPCSISDKPLLDNLWINFNKLWMNFFTWDFLSTNYEKVISLISKCKTTSSPRESREQEIIEPEKTLFVARSNTCIANLPIKN